MPPAGEAIVEVNGETFVFTAADMTERTFTCEIRDNGITVNFQSDDHNLVLNGATQADGSILVSATVIPEGSDFQFDSSNAGGNSGG